MLHRVAGGFRFADGHIVVANGGTQEVRVYDARGRFLLSGGRRGEGRTRGAVSTEAVT